MFYVLGPGLQKKVYTSYTLDTCGRTGVLALAEQTLHVRNLGHICALCPGPGLKKQVYASYTLDTCGLTGALAFAGQTLHTIHLGSTFWAQGCRKKLHVINLGHVWAGGRALRLGLAEKLRKLYTLDTCGLVGVLCASGWLDT